MLKLFYIIINMIYNKWRNAYLLNSNVNISVNYGKRKIWFICAHFFYRTVQFPFSLEFKKKKKYMTNANENFYPELLLWKGKSH